MVLTKEQIKELKKAVRKAEILENKSQLAAGHIAYLVTKFTKVDGHVDHLQGDGFGFTPSCDDDTHIPLDILINLAVDGKDINEELILDNLSI